MPVHTYRFYRADIMVKYTCGITTEIKHIVLSALVPGACKKYIVSAVC